MKALVIGATGATGKKLVNNLLSDAAFDQVHVFVRTPPNLTNAKLNIHVVDFEQPDLWSNLVTGEVAFSCLGTTLQAAGSKEAQWKIDYEYQYNFAASAKKNGVERFILVSAYGANPNAKVFYSRMKGELDVAVEKLGFPKVVIFHPGMLERTGSDRLMEVLGIKILGLLNKIGLLKKQKPLPTQVLAQAMINASKAKNNGSVQVDLDQIFELAKTR